MRTTQPLRINKKKNHRNKLTALLRITERKYHGNQLEINKNDSTICWKITKEVIGTKNSINSDSCVFKINDTEVLRIKKSSVMNLITSLSILAPS